jgi:hypothetical protein
LISAHPSLAEIADLFYPEKYTTIMLKVSSMAISAIQGAASPAAPAPKAISTTTEIQRAAAAKASEQVRQPETVQQPAKATAPPPKVENTNNRPPPPPPTSVVNTRGEVTGGTINTSA